MNSDRCQRKRTGNGLVIVLLLVGGAGILSFARGLDPRVLTAWGARLVDAIPPLFWLTGLAAGALLLTLIRLAQAWRRERQTSYATGLSRGERSGRADVVHEVRMLAHAHLKTQVWEAERRLDLALATTDPEQRRLLLEDARHSLGRLHRVTEEIQQQALRQANDDDAALPVDLERTLCDVTRSLSSEGSRCVLEVAGVPRSSIPRAITQALETILYNALANAQRHGRASFIQVQLAYDLDHVTLTVADNGQGFDLRQVTRSSRGRGIRDMRRLAERYAGHCDVQSRVGQGTTVTATVPLPPPSLGWASAPRPERNRHKYERGDDASATTPTVGDGERCAGHYPSDAPAHPDRRRCGDGARAGAGSAVPPWLCGDRGDQW